MFPNPAAMMAMAKQAGMPMPPGDPSAFMYPGFFPGTMPPKPPDGANATGGK
jgi:hypothetical protein